MGMIPRGPKDYGPSRTEQSHKDSCDIDKILARAARAGTLSHLQLHGARYGDFADFDFQDAQNQIAKGKSIFAALPGELRREFGNDPARFFAYVNDPDNSERLPELLPHLAQPGRQHPLVDRGSQRTKGTERRGAAAADPVASAASDSVASAASDLRGSDGGNASEASEPPAQGAT